MTERIWDRFLTEEDKDGLGPSRRVGFGKAPALVLVDLYRWVFGDEPMPLREAVKTWPGSCGMAAWDALPHIQTMLDAARDAKIPIIHITGIDPLQQFIPGWSERVHPTSSRDLTDAEQDRLSRRWDIIDEVAPLPGEGFLRKSAPSAFWGTPLAAHLNTIGVDTVIVVGESTSGCVRATVVEGATYSYRMIVAEEGVFDRQQASHAINLFDMDRKYGDVLPMGEILEWLAVWRQEQTSKAY